MNTERLAQRLSKARKAKTSEVTIVGDTSYLVDVSSAGKDKVNGVLVTRDTINIPFGLDRKSVVEYTCNCTHRNSDGEVEVCNGNISAHTMCYHSFAALTAVARSHGSSIAFTEKFEDAVNLSKLGGILVVAKSGDGNGHIYAVVKVVDKEKADEFKANEARRKLNQIKSRISLMRGEEDDYEIN